MADRNWSGDVAVFATRIDIWTILPDEDDVLELGPRAAVGVAEQAVPPSLVGSVRVHNRPIRAQNRGSAHD